MSATRFPPVEEQLARLTRGAVDVVERSQLADKLARSRASGKPLLIKTGFDPSSPDLHLGHTVLLRKMRHFQEQGHRVVFLIGAFTALIGDPTGKNTTRPQLTEEEVQANARTYQEPGLQGARPREDRGRLQRPLAGAARRRTASCGSAGRYTLARIMEREDFRTRYPRAADPPPRVALPARPGLRLGGAGRPTSSSAATTRSSTCWSGAT